MAVLHITKDTFQAEVLESEKTVLLDFWATWCGPCRMIAPVLEEVAQEREDVKVCKIDVDQEPELARQFQIMSIPTLIVMEKGKIINQALGAMPKNSVLALLP
ncbi:MAG: thioredoxin [Oscillospiraceae bacterium]|nr:thioredoxin [Oscillospiraceae bacterium]